MTQRWAVCFYAWMASSTRPDDNDDIVDVMEVMYENYDNLMTLMIIMSGNGDTDHVDGKGDLEKRDDIEYMMRMKYII